MSSSSKLAGMSFFRLLVAPAFAASMQLIAVLSCTSQIRKDVPGQVPQEDEVIRVNTQLVTIPVNVVDRQGRLIPDLKREQFAIYEDGVEQEVAYFDDYQSPLTICLLVDTSDSTKFKLGEIQAAAADFIRKLKPADKVAVVSFDREVNILNDMKGDRTQATTALQKIRTGSGTSIYNAIDVALRQVLGPATGRKAMVVFSDGVDTTSASATYQSTVDLAMESNSVIYVIRYDTYADATEDARRSSMSQEQMSMRIGNEPARLVYERASLYLRGLTDVTGGSSFEAGSSERLSDSFDQILEKLREQYSIGYYPLDLKKPGRRRVTVKIRAANVKVRARRYYVVAAAKAHE